MSKPTKSPSQVLSSAEQARAIVELPLADGLHLSVQQKKALRKHMEAGIARGIEQYKTQQREKSQHVDKQLKKAKATFVAASNVSCAQCETRANAPKPLPLAWLLLAVSWLGFAAFVWWSSRA